ncbi:MAG: hypothetical protein EOP45_04840 [Sphingobacteriaceae bacterium]|nr:MAG: hypothetical protein EOP45_04840 [Sphingobacteriaceae bacterium]
MKVLFKLQYFIEKQLHHRNSLMLYRSVYSMNQQKIFVILLWIIAFSTGCSGPHPGWKTIEMGNYLIDVPSSFHLSPAQGIDSEVGELKGKGISFSYEYGAYTDTLISTAKEYLDSGRWRDEAVIRYLDTRKYPVQNFTEVKVTSYRPSLKPDSSLAGGCDYVARCTYAGKVFELPIFIPREIKDHIVTKDTVEHHLRRLDRPKKGMNRLTGVYIRDERGNLFNGMNYPALQINAMGLNLSQQKLALEIFATLRPKQTAKK